jgi:HD-like signal output (HDOD) protein
MNKKTGKTTRFLPLQTPSLFVVSKKLITVCEDRHIQAAELHRLICLDPVLFRKTQNLYHYFYPAAKNRHVSIAKIIIVLNPNTIKNYLLDFAYAASSLIETKKVSAAEIAGQKKRWQHTHSIAIATRFFAKENGVPPEKLEEYYAAGILHDIDEYIKNEPPVHKKLFGGKLVTAVNDAHHYTDDKSMRKLVRNELISSEIFLGIRRA